MGWTSPFTAVAGTAWKAADWNTYGRDNLTWLATDSPACRAYNSAAIATNNVTQTALTLNSERFDNASVHSTSSNTARFTVPTGAGGKYLFGATVDWAANATGLRGLSCYLNGTTYIARDYRQAVTDGGTGTVIPLVGTYSLAAADYIEFYGVQVSGGSLNMSATPGYGPEAWMMWFRT